MEDPKVGIGVFVVKGGRFLMGQRKNAHGQGTWSVPGGHLEYSESWQETSAREVLEETGVEITGIKFGAVTNDFFTDEGKHYVTIWMLSTWSSGNVQLLEPDKFVAHAWHTFDNLPQPLFLPWKNLLSSHFIEGIKSFVAEH